MKLIRSTLALSIFTIFLFTQAVTSQEINWLSWEEAVVKSKESKKKIFVDVYTEWCGWCKRMDQTTFKDPEVVTYMNDHFYAVKLDAEMRKDIKFKDHVFKWVEGGRNGVHLLAYSLLDGKLSYPSFVMLNEEFDRIAISPGYKQAPQILKELKYAAEEKYTETSWDQYIRDSE